MKTAVRSVSGNMRLILQHLMRFFRSDNALVVGLLFAAHNMIFSSWIAHIPYIKQQLNLNEGQLGLALFGMPLGLLCMNPFTGRIIHFAGARRTALWSMVGFILFVQIPVHAGHFAVLVGGLFFCGLSSSLMNVAMNTCAVYVEKQDHTRLLATCHGMWSLGGVAGAGLAGLMIWAGWSPPVHVGWTGILLLATAAIWLRKGLDKLPEYRSEDEKPASLAKPNKALWLMIFIGLSVSMGEGLAFDWSGVYLRQNAGAPFEIAALGFALFALAMTIGRFSGDAIVPKIGEKKILSAGAVCIVAGIAICVLFPGIGTCLTGFFLLGIGCSLGNPMLYAMSMRIPGIAPAAGLATFASLSMLGFLTGPPLIGFIAEAWNLAWGFVFVGMLSVASYFLVKYL